jgi:light-regulated signal transduction histidine kinase (bacteriophytochrome)
MQVYLVSCLIESGIPVALLAGNVNNSFLIWLEREAYEVFHSNCLNKVHPDAIAIKDQASGALSISIALNYSTYHIICHIIWFRQELIQTVNWAGDPNNLFNVIDENEPSPKRSFSLWKETVKAKSLPWIDVEIEAAVELRSTLMLAALEFSQQSLKQEAERSQIASQAESSFLARMSHELRTPRV